jgi:formate--tetrahydrofolate ligase
VHGGLSLEEASLKEDTRAIQRGFENLERHLKIIKRFGLTPVVTVNRFQNDTETELQVIHEHCLGLKVRCSVSTVSEQGGEGGLKLAQEVMAALQEKSFKYEPLYPLDLPVEEKITRIAKEIYGADGVEFVESAPRDLEEIKRNGFSGLPINMAKTQLSLTDNPKQKGAPSGWKLQVREIRVAAGAGFLVALTGKILTMPGLPKKPLAEQLDVDDNGRASGLF